MSNDTEWILIALLMAGVAFLVWDLLRRRLRERDERDLLDRLSAETPTAIMVPVEATIVEKKLRSAGLRGPAEAYVFAASLFAVVVSVLILRALPALPLLALIGFGLALYVPW